jgi:hypothetical protein
LLAALGTEPPLRRPSDMCYAASVSQNPDNLPVAEYAYLAALALIVLAICVIVIDGRWAMMLR